MAESMNPLADVEIAALDVVMAAQGCHRRCPCCQVIPGQTHEVSCDVARCAHCGWQHIQCDSPAARPDAWSGEWPGDLECREFGLWVKEWDATNPGWFKTTADDPLRREDLNKLA
jgi:hypothetical protein